MLSRPVVVGLVASGCIVAAGLGAYVAVRQNSPASVAPAAAAVTPPAEAAVPLGGGVAETEAVVRDEDARTTQKPETGGREAKPSESARRPKPAPAAKSAAPVAESNESPSATPAPPQAGWTGLDRPWPPRPPQDPPVDSALPSVGEPLPIEPPEPQFRELTIATDSVVGLQIDRTISTETAQLEDRVEARVTRDVMADGRVAVPAGTRVLGSVTLVEKGGKFKERARLGVRFHTLVMGDASRVPIQTESIFREGDPPSQGSVAKIGGGAAVGAILGAILGGGKGAVIGGATGAAGGTAATMASGPKPATLAAGTTFTVRLTSPATVTVER